MLELGKRERERDWRGERSEQRHEMAWKAWLRMERAALASAFIDRRSGAVPMLG